MKDDSDETKLGKKGLFFEKELLGNQDIGCRTVKKVRRFQSGIGTRGNREKEEKGQFMGKEKREGGGTKQRMGG